MRVTTRAFYKKGQVFYSRQSEDVMSLHWLHSLHVPSTATTLWFRLLDEPTEHSIPVTIRAAINYIEIVAGEFNYVIIHQSEFRTGDFQKLQNSREGAQMHLQIQYCD
jgi:hypothetical protein